MALKAETIFECAFDNELFAQLPHLITREFDARSMIFHLLTKDGNHSIAASSGYWSKEQLETYAADFVSKDILLERRLAPQNINQVWNVTEDLLSRNEFLSSQIYNEHYRAFGDDIYHAIGGCFDTKRGQIAIGIHRSYKSPAFDKNHVLKLRAISRDIMNLLMTRAEILVLERNSEALREVTNNANISYIIVDKNSKLLDSNYLGEKNIIEKNNMSVNAGFLRASDNNGVNIQNTIMQAAVEKLAREIYILSPEGEISRFRMTPVASGNHWANIIVTYENWEMNEEEISQILIKNYGLSKKETQVALMIGTKRSIAQIAKLRNVSINTIKSQLNAIYNKTKTGSQMKLAMFIERLRH